MNRLADVMGLARVDRGSHLTHSTRAEPDGFGNRFRTFAEAYPQVVRDVLESGTPVAGACDPFSIGSSFGEAPRPTRELLAYGFVIDDPDNSLLRVSPRPVDVTFSVAQLLWTFAGSDDVRWIAYYNGRGMLFSDDGVRLPRAVGYRVRHADGAGDQLAAAIQRLRKDPSTRRAVLYLASPSDALAVTRDHPCASVVHFLLRDDLLIATVMMRSQSALMVLPYDVFLFTSLQKLVADALCVQVGPYYHFASSFHVYEDEIELSEEVVNSDVRKVDLGSFTGVYQQLPDLLREERRLRAGLTVRDDAGSSLLKVEDSFARNAWLLLAMRAAELAGEEALRGVLLGQLPTDVRETVELRFPR